MLTERTIRDARPGPKTALVWDRQVKGLGLRIASGGTKSYILNYRVDGRSRRATIGRAGEITLKEARERARRELAAIRAGEADPLERRRAAREAPTVADLVARFLGPYADGRKQRGLMAPRTFKEYRKQCASNILPAIGARKVADVQRADIERMVEPLKPTMRNRVLALTHRLFNLAEHWEWRPQHTNPARGIEKAREQPRDRVLAPEEMAALAAALEDIAPERPAAVAAIRVAALTGLRISEVLAIKWEHLDFDTGRLLLPETKTGRRWHDLPAPALAVLADLPRATEWAFEGGRSYKRVAAVFRHACETAGLANCRLHDLRRTVATGAAAAGMSALELRALLGWKNVAMPARYVALAGDSVAANRRAVGERMAAMMDGKAGDVVPLRRA
jgi:integrase